MNAATTDERRELPWGLGLRVLSIDCKIRRMRPTVIPTLTRKACQSCYVPVEMTVHKKFQCSICSLQRVEFPTYM